MAVSGAVAAALRNEGPYSDWIGMGARLILDPAGRRTGGRPYYWRDGRAYSTFLDVPGASFTRASTGYAEMVDKTLTQFASGAPRVTDKGLFIEGSRTNSLLQSTDILNATSWSPSAAVVQGTGSAPVRTANAGVAPDKTNTATRLQLSLNGGTTTSDRSGIDQGLTVVSGSTYTSGVWLKSYDGNSYTVLVEANLAVVGSPRLFTVTPVWQRFESVSLSAATSGGYRIYLQGTTGVTNIADILVWAPQFELTAASASSASSPIPTTTTAVTRAADIASVSGLNAFALQPFTLVVTASTTTTGSQLGVVSINDGTSNNHVDLRMSSTGGGSAADGQTGGSSIWGTSLGLGAPTGANRNMALRVRSDQGAYCRDGGNIVTATPSFATPTTTRLLLGALDGGSNYLGGYLQQVAIFGELSDAQMRRITA